MRATIALVAAASLMLPGAALGRGQPGADSPPPQVFRQVTECRSIADNGARLACYDREVAALDSAQQSRDIVIAERKDVTEVRRGLFGWAIPVGRIFGIGKGSDGEELQEVDTTVTSVGTNRAGILRLAFKDSGTWDQVDLSDFAVSPRVGQPAKLSKGAFGSYFVSVNKQPAIKMRRVE